MKIIIPSCKPAEQLTSLLNDIITTMSSGPEIILINNEDAGAAENRNAGLRQCEKGEVVIYIDDDISGFYPGWDLDLVKPLEDKDVLMVSARLMTAGGFPARMNCENYELDIDTIYTGTLPSAAIAFVWDGLLFDENLKRWGYEDALYCYELRAKYPFGKFAIYNGCKLIHANEEKYRDTNLEENRAYFERRKQEIDLEYARKKTGMVSYSWGGGVGNQLFQYTSARLLSERLNYTFIDDSHNLNVVTPDKPGGNFYGRQTPDQLIIEGPQTPSLLETDFKAGHIRLEGYWQRTAYYLPNRDKIRAYFKEQALVKTNKEDIVMHVRLRDYRHFGPGGTILKPDYYMDCLRREDFDRLYIVTEEPEDEYLDVFKEAFRGEYTLISSKAEKDDFWFIAGFDRIICANSSFSWWAAFLSNASKIYTPKCWIRNCDNFVDLWNIQNGIPMEAGFLDY